MTIIIVTFIIFPTASLVQGSACLTTDHEVAGSIPGTSQKNFEIVPTWKTKKGKTSKFVDARGYNRNERESGTNNMEWIEREEWRRKIRPRNSWMQELRTGMKEKGINNMEWIEREEWRKNIKIQAQKDVKPLILWTLIKIIL